MTEYTYYEYFERYKLPHEDIVTSWKVHDSTWYYLGVVSELGDGTWVANEAPEKYPSREAATKSLLVTYES